MDIGPFLGELVPHPPLSCEFFKNTLKEREFGLLEKYKTDDQFKKLCGILDRLGFLPPQLVPQELTTREKSTGDIGYLLDYLDCTYFNGRFRYASVPSAAAPRANSSLRLTLRRRRPEFPRYGGICTTPLFKIKTG